MPYFLLQGTVLWPPVLWAIVFTAINLYQIARIYLERRPVVLSADEQKLYDLGFRSLRPREFVSLSLVGEWKSAEAGERIVTEGEPVSGLCIPITGSAEVRKQGERLGSDLHRARPLHALVAPEPAQVHGQAAGPARHAARSRQPRSCRQGGAAVVAVI
jgi:hypothetical protein